MRAACVCLLLAVACTQFPPGCDTRALRELRTVDRLIAETRRNISRGYTYEYEAYGYRTGFVVCSGGYDVRICTGNDNRPRRRAVAIDPAAEQRKLDQLQDKREQLSARATGCRSA